MMKDIKTLIEIVGLIRVMTDQDGICENGCSCGECENCLDYESVLLDFYMIKEKYKNNLESV